MAQITLTLRQLIENNIQIFNYDYAFYNEEHKGEFEKKFIDKYLFREIGFESPAMFKHYLRSTLNEIMPKYEHLYKTTLYEYNPILNYDVTESNERDLTTNDTSTYNGTGENKSIDTPISSSKNYKNNPSFIEIQTNEDINNKKGIVKETNKRKMQGNIGVQTTQDLILKERSVIINIDKMILEELEILFMGVF